MLRPCSKTQLVFCPTQGSQYRSGPLRLLIQHRSPTFGWPYSVKDFALNEGVGNGAIMPGVSGIVGIVTLQPHMTLWYHNLLNMASAGSGKNSDTITFQTKHSLAHNQVWIYRRAGHDHISWPNFLKLG